MAINESLLVTTNVFQDCLRDKDTGLPLAAGIVTCYEDSSRTVLKNWYAQYGSPGAYTYIALDNPLTLSSVGTVQDSTGNDVLPFFYPYDEATNSASPSPQPYYITIVNSGNVSQFTRQNFPFVPQVNAETNVQDYNDLIVNGEFWRNASGNTGSVTVSAETDYVLAPSQHDGFSMPDIRWQKDVADGTDVVEFKSFVLDGSTLTDDITPQVFMNIACTNAGTSTYKRIQIPIQLHIDSLSQAQGAFSIQLRGGSTSVNNVVTIALYSYYGTGAVTPAATVVQTVTLTTSWQKQLISLSFPDTSGLALGDGGDDAYYIQIGLPAGSGKDFNVEIAMPHLYLGEGVSTTSYKTYDQVAAITSSPRTGDIRTSMNSFAPYGWVMCNDGVLSNAGSTLPSGIPAMRANIDAWQLFSLLWNAIPATFAPIYDSGGSVTTRGATAIADWSAGKQLLSPKMLANVLLGIPETASVTYTYNSAPSWNSAVNGYFTVTSSRFLYIGAPVFLTGTMPTSGNFTANTVYYMIPATDGSNTTQFQLAASYSDAVLANAIAAGSASDNGSSIVLNFQLGGNFGQASHVQSISEIAAHTHGLGAGAKLVTAGQQVYSTASGGSGSDTLITPSSTHAVGASSYQPQGTTLSTGAGNPFNVVQPSTYINMFFKL